MTRMMALVLTGLLLTPAVLPAHEGHDHKIMGVVSVIHENHLEVKDLKGKATSLVLGTATRIRRGKMIVRSADIKVGDRVVVVYRETKDKAGKVTVTVREVQLGVA
jgi:hypothetical protein